jgi:hypothetical protein
VNTSLSVLLSQALLAFTIEFDNEFEHRMPHSTARGPAAESRGPWLVSMAMWSNYLRFVDAGTTRTDDLALLANEPGLVRWGYLTRALALRPAGRRACDIFRPLGAEIEVRWADRLDVPALRALLDPFDDPSLPSALPVAWRTGAAPKLTLWNRDDPLDDLGSVLSRVLLKFTLAFEELSSVPLQLDANVLRVVPAAAKDLAALAGVSKEAAAGSISPLRDRGLVEELPERTVAPTEHGRRAQAGYPTLLAAVEKEWGDVEPLRSALSAIDLAAGLRPYPDGWRAHAPYLRQTQRVLADPRAALPHYPMVLHRGGYPDGS